MTNFILNQIISRPAFRLQKLPKLERSFVDLGNDVRSIAQAKEEIARNLKYITENFDKFPYYEYVRMLERNFLLLSVIGRLEPLIF